MFESNGTMTVSPYNKGKCLCDMLHVQLISSINTLLPYQLNAMSCFYIHVFGSIPLINLSALMLFSKIQLN